VARDLGGDDLGDPLSSCRQGDVLFAEGDADLAGDDVGFRVGGVAALVAVDSPGEVAMDTIRLARETGSR
jgi:hypothetical protein